MCFTNSSFLWWDTVLGEARPLSPLVFHLGMLFPTTFLPRSVTSSLLLSASECTVLATNWKSNKILIISCQLFNIFFHSKMSSGWQQHAECSCACAAAWWGSSPEGFPRDTLSLACLCPLAWSSYMFIDIITSTITISLGSLAHWTVSQEQCSAHVSMISAGSFLHLCLKRCLKPTVTTATGI